MQNLPPHLSHQSQSPMENNPLMEGQMMNQMPETGEQDQKIVAHFAPDELHSLDELQGEVVIDPETGLRDYTLLDEILKNPEIRDAISEGLSQERKKFAMGGEVNEPGRPTDPELEQLRLEGHHGDTELAIITPYLLETFAQWGGTEPKINHETGLPEFGLFGNLFKSIARIGGTVLGGIFGGPVGAALGGGLATKLTGGSWGQSLGAGALGGLGAFAAPALGGFFGGSGGGTGGFLSNLFSPSTGGGVMSPHGLVGGNTIGRMLPGSAFGQNIQAAGQTGGGGFLGNILGGSGGGGGILSKMGQALPLAGSALLMAKGNRDEQRGIRDYQRALESKEQKEKAENESMRQRMGFNDKLKPVEPYRRRQVTPNISREDYLRGAEPLYFENYAEGGAIRGHGKGQQDNIPKDIKENSYIIDASTVSDIGDGSSEAGIKELDHWIGQFPSYGKQHESKGGYINAMVSNDEYAIPPEKVTAIGHGSNKKGAQILKKLVSQVRSQKRTSGNRLPPKAKPIGGYLKNMRHVNF